MTGDKGTPSAIHAGMGVINPEAHAAKATRTPTGRARIHSKSHAHIGGPL